MYLYLFLLLSSTHVLPSRGNTLGQPPFSQQDHPQPAQRLVHLFFLQKTERRAHISRAFSIWEKHGARKREDAASESLGPYDARRVTVLAEQEFEPEGRPASATDDARAALR